MKKKVIAFIILIIITISVYLSDLSASSIILNSSNLSNMNGHLVEFTGESPQSVFSQTLSLNSGSYNGLIHYTTSDSNNSFIIKNNGQTLASYELVPSSSQLSFQFTIPRSTLNTEIELFTQGTGYICIDDIILNSSQSFYNDIYLIIAAIWILFFIVILLFTLHEQGKISYSTFYYVTFIIAVTTFFSLPILSGNFSFGGDDLHYHISRIEGIKDGILSGQFPVVIYPEALNGHGYLNSMYPSLFLYPSALLRILGVSYVAAYKFLLIFIQLATVVSISYVLKKFEASPIVILIGTILFTVFRYRLANLFIRAAIGETIALIFYPLIILGIYQMLNHQGKDWHILFIGMTGLLQSHILSFVIALIILFVICAVEIKKIMNKKILISILKATFFAILCNLWFLIPFLYYYRSDVINPGILQGNYSNSSLSISYLFGTSLIDSTVRPHSLGLPIIFCFFAISILMYLNKTSDNKSRFLHSLFGIACTLLFISTSLFPSAYFMNFKIFKNTFTFLQFPWRLVGPAVVLIIMVFCLIISRIQLTKQAQYIVAAAIIIISLSDCSVWQNNAVTQMIGYELSSNDYNKSDAHIDKILFQSNLTAQYPNEWRTPQATSNEVLQYGYSLSDPSIATVTSFEKNYDRISLAYSASKNSTIELPLINYKCYRITDEHNQQIPYSTSENGRILLSLIPDSDIHIITTQYQFPFIFYIANGISLIALLLLTIFYIKKINSKHKENL